MAGYEAAIDYLDSLSLIDRTRIGIIGFSRTVGLVEYTLTHSRYDFAAAVAADGVDFSYLQYMLLDKDIQIDFDAVNGGSPFGSSLARQWLKDAPGFNVDKIRAPLRLEFHGSFLLGGWEMYASLERLQKPVELVYIPDGDHVLAKPWERMTSQQGTVDWFCFWLKNEEDPNPAKAEQYTRWRELRERARTNREQSTDVSETVRDGASR